MKKSSQYFDFNRFRNVFNIFVEEKLEKELIENFNEWNVLFNEKEERFISYLISYKWFESWKIYVLEAYGKTLNLNLAKNPTMKNIKTKKTFKSCKDIGTSKKKIAKTHHLRELKLKG